ncbi:MAG: TldD/PmbA family protein [Candidatus Micrarchaeota archaeon]
MKEFCVEVVDKLRRLGADVAIANASTSVHKQVKFANNKIVRSSVEQSEHCQIFIAVGKKTAETVIEKNAVNLKEKLAVFVALAKKLPDNKEFLEVTKGKFQYPKINAFDERTANANEELVEIVQQSLGGIEQTRAGGVLETNASEEYLLSSAGPEASFKSTNAYFSMRCIAEQNASGHKVACDSAISKLNAVQLSREASNLAVKAKNPVVGQQGTFNVVFDALPFAALLDPFVHSTSVFSVESGLSALTGKIGSKVTSDCISIYDDPLNASAFHATPFDEEGQPTKRTAIVENGVLKTYLHNSSTAKRYEVKPTGHAGIVSPHPWNPIVKNGNSGLDELVREAKNGIYVTNIWYTRFQNYSTSDFSSIPRDAIFLIENGEITKPIRGIRISDNLLKMLSNIKLLSKHQRQIYGWEVDTPIFSSDALVENVNVTTPQG